MGSTSNTQATITDIDNNGPYIVRATIILSGCSIQLEHEFESAGVGLGPIGPMSMEVEPLFGVCTPIFYISIDPVSGAESYEWNCINDGDSGINIIHCNGYGTQLTVKAKVSTNAQVEFSIRVTVYPECGEPESRLQTFYYAPPDGMNCQPGIIELYPNPASSFLTVEIPGETTEGTVHKISIKDQFNQPIFYTETTERSLTIDTGSFQNGVYAVQVVNNGELSSASIIIQQD